MAETTRGAEEEPSTGEDVNWPQAISQLQQELYRWPGKEQIRRQLAVAHNNYGVDLGKQQQWALAEGQLEEAMRLDKDNPQFRDNLVNIRLNEAQSAYERHRLGEASQLIDKAVALNPDAAPAYMLRGRVEYDRQHLKEAKTAWQRALELNPSQPEVEQWLGRVTEEFPVESKFERLSQASFDLRYEEQLERPVGFDVRDALLDARRSVGSDFSYWPGHKIVVLIYSAQRFRELRQETPDWVAGQFDGKIRVPLPDRQLDSRTVKRILFHEYTHALIHDLTSDRCPLWLNEGLAEFEGRNQEPVPHVLLRRAREQQAVIPWSELSDHISASRSAQDVGLAYEEAHSIVAFLLDRYSLWRIRRVLKSIGEGKSWEDVLNEEFHRKPNRLESDWQEWLPAFLAKEP